MKIGIPEELKQGEKRVALTPGNARELISLGAEIFVESDAGLGSGFTNEAYIQAGAKVLDNAKDIWNSSELIIKVKEPQCKEYAYFREDLSIFCFLHPAAFPELMKEILKSKVCALDYDLLMLDDGRLPILEPMSVIAGKLSIQCGAYALQSASGGAGVLLGGACSVPPAKVLIVGGGVAGVNAASVATGIGAEAVVLDIDKKRLQSIKNKLPSIRTELSSEERIRTEITDSMLVIGSVLVPGDLAPKLITEDMLKTMPKGSVIVDICIDQGGFAESSKPTTISNPTFEKHDVVHYCVANMPALVPRTSTEALTNESIKWIKLLLKNGIQNALQSSPELKTSLISINGQLTNQVVANALKS